MKESRAESRLRFAEQKRIDVGRVSDPPPQVEDLPYRRRTLNFSGANSLDSEL